MNYNDYINNIGAGERISHYDALVERSDLFLNYINNEISGGYTAESISKKASKILSGGVITSSEILRSSARQLSYLERRRAISEYVKLYHGIDMATAKDERDKSIRLVDSIGLFDNIYFAYLSHKDDRICIKNINTDNSINLFDHPIMCVQFGGDISKFYDYAHEAVRGAGL